MIRSLIFILFLVFILPACAPQKPRGSSVVIKPKTHKRYFVKKDDRYKKRTKLVRMKG
jgi:hypothetical protein